MADLDDRSAALHAQDRRVAPERRQSVPDLPGLRRPHARRAPPISQSTQSADWSPQTHRVPHRNSNPGDPCRVHRANSEIPQEPDAAHPSLRHRGSRGRDHWPDSAGSLPDRTRAHPAHRQGQQDPRRTAHRENRRAPARLPRRVPPGHHQLPATRPVFYSLHRGRPAELSADTVAAVLKQAAESARAQCRSIPQNIHCHLLRKTKAMDLYQQGIPLPIIMRLLGHENTSTTAAFYAFATLDMMRQAINAATPAINIAATEPLTEDQLQTLYSLR